MGGVGEQEIPGTTDGVCLCLNFPMWPRARGAWWVARAVCGRSRHPPYSDAQMKELKKKLAEIAADPATAKDPAEALRVFFSLSFIPPSVRPSPPIYPHVACVHAYIGC